MRPGFPGTRSSMNEWLASGRYRRSGAQSLQSLQNWVRITTTLQEVGGAEISSRQDIWPSAEAADIARRVGVTLACNRTRSGGENGTESPACRASYNPGGEITSE